MEQDMLITPETNSVDELANLNHQSENGVHLNNGLTQIPEPFYLNADKSNNVIPNNQQEVSPASVQQQPFYLNLGATPSPPRPIVKNICTTGPPLSPLPGDPASPCRSEEPVSPKVEVLNVLRGILVGALPRENLPEPPPPPIPSRNKGRKVTFVEAGALPLQHSGAEFPSGTANNSGEHNKQQSSNNDPPQRPHRDTNKVSVRTTMHWFACVGPPVVIEESSPDPSAPLRTAPLELGEESSRWFGGPSETPKRPQHSAREETPPSRRDSAADILGAGKDGSSQKDREDRIRALKERQNEERQRKLDELKQQALAAQRFREQKEEERRRRIEELRQRDQERRSQVEERKRALWEAERDKRDNLIRKSLEREARLVAKRRNERSSIVFAFGSSTPRMLEPADTGGSFWGTRRATSTTNVMFSGAPLTRRSSERELDLGAVSKKRATSAHALDRKPGEDMKMSTSMYEVFHWDLSNPPPEPLTPTGMASLTGKPPRAPKPALSLPPQSPPLSPFCQPSRVVALIRGEEDLEDGSSGHLSSRARKRTDLMPTIPSSRDGSAQRSRHRSPGKSQSMLNLVSPPRAPPRVKPSPPPPSSPLSVSQKSSSRSMTHLNKGKQAPPPQSTVLRKTRTSQSMSHLAGRTAVAPPQAPPRTTRAERLRAKARQMAAPSAKSAATVQQTTASSNKQTAGQQGTMRSGDVTPSVPSSRPQSAMSQSSERSAAHGSAQLRPRPPTRSKPRPISIAVTGVSSDISKTPRATASADNKDNRPPMPRPRKGSAPTPTPAKSGDSKKPLSATRREKLTPKSTPLVSPATENPPTPISAQQEKEILVQAPDEQPEKQDAMKPVDTPPATPVAPSTKESQPQNELQEKQAIKIEPECDVTPSQAAVVNEELPECDMSASMMARRITTEEGAKAALAERRRLAREQAEREAELERQRQEEQERLEAERQRQEEEEQRQAEEEQLRLLEEARKAEEQRLLEAIEEAQRREVEEARAREEEAKQRAEREEAEKKAREDSERIRQETIERLKREEEERQARRKRVEAIMSRTRKGGGTPHGTPNKGDGEDDSGKTSPTEELEDKPRPASPTPPTHETNGHHRMDENDDVKQNNAANSSQLLDLTEGLNNGSNGPNKASSNMMSPSILDFDAPEPVTLKQENGSSSNNSAVAVADLLS